MEDLYLPPRRKNMQQNNADNSEYCHFFSYLINNAYTVILYLLTVGSDSW